MAQKLQVLLTCDLHDGGVEAVDTVTFAYRGETYAFELCQEHLAEFEAVMDGWVAVARRLEPAGRLRTGGTSPLETGSIRDWARSEGYELSERGRIPAEVRAAYEAAHRS